METTYAPSALPSTKAFPENFLGELSCFLVVRIFHNFREESFEVEMILLPSEVMAQPVSESE
jgi:hypothetical protein